MTAVPDVTDVTDVPRTWRPLGTRLALFFFGGLLAAVCVFFWIAIGPEVRSQFTPFQRVTLILFVLLFTGTYYGLERCRLVATDAGLTVVNGYRTRRFEWPQVIALSLKRGAPWATLDLSDGTTVSVMGIQGSDGDRARRQVREVRAYIAAHTPA